MKIRKHAQIALVAAAALALPATPPAHALDDDVGTECGSCQFPTAVRMPLCSGVYVGQNMVLTAAHCVSNVNEGTSRAYFGEDSSDAAASAVIESCVRHPDGSGSAGAFGDSYDGVDLAFCILSDEEALPDLPIVPPMTPTGCERDWLAHQVYASGSHPIVTAVGSGCADYYNGGTHCDDGVKRYLALQLIQQTTYNGSSTKLEVERWGELSTRLMDGDSGGPLFEVLPDGSWRLLGVLHGTNVALKAGFYEAIPPYLHWIEAESGIDITPCHEFQGGEWKVAGSCAGELPLDTNLAGGSWASACPSALGGGVIGFIGGLCGAWPTTPDEYAAGLDEPVLPNDLFVFAAQSIVANPTRSQPAAAERISAKVEKLAVFPFLESEGLPETVALDLLQDPTTLGGIELMTRSGR